MFFELLNIGLQNSGARVGKFFEGSNAINVELDKFSRVHFLGLPEPSSGRDDFPSLTDHHHVSALVRDALRFGLDHATHDEGVLRVDGQPTPLLLLC